MERSSEKPNREQRIGESKPGRNRGHFICMPRAGGSRGRRECARVITVMRMAFISAAEGEGPWEGVRGMEGTEKRSHRRKALCVVWCRSGSGSGREIQNQVQCRSRGTGCGW